MKQTERTVKKRFNQGKEKQILQNSDDTILQLQS